MNNLIPVTHSVLMDVIRYLNRDAQEDVQIAAMREALHSHCVQKDMVLHLDGNNLIFIVNVDNISDYGYMTTVADNYNSKIKLEGLYAGVIGPLASKYPLNIHGEEDNLRYNMALGDEI